MKTLVIATVAALGLAGAASADGLGVNAYGEYAFEAEAFEIGLGATYGIEALTLSAGVVAVKPNNVSFDVDHLDLGAAYALTGNASLYGNVELNADLEYTESTVGVAFQF